MWEKSNGTWNKRDSILDTDEFIKSLDKLKTYSKCIDASAYSVTHTLEDIYNILSYQNPFWIKLTNIAPESIQLEKITLVKEKYYNLSLLYSNDELINSDEIRDLLSNGLVKAANALLFEDESNVEWFDTYEPVLEPIFGTNSTGGLFTIDNDVIFTHTTSGTVYDNSYDYLLFDENYTKFDITSEYQTSDIDYGYSIRNVFTSSKVLSKMLKNFYVVDAVSNENVELFDSLGQPNILENLQIDGVTLVDNQVVILKDQVDATENGIYRYTTQNLNLIEDIFNNVEDFNLFSVYSKEGNINKYKEFFLERNQDGTYPLVDDEKYFFEGDNYVIRNKVNYRLFKDHKFKSSKYLTEIEYETEFDFSNEIDNGTDGTYRIENGDLKLFSVDGTILEEYGYTDSLNNTIKTFGSELYVSSKKEILSFGTSFNVLYENDLNVTDFHVEDSNNIILLDTEFKIKELNLSSTSSNVIQLLENTYDFEYCAVSTDEYYFYLTESGLYINKDNRNYNLFSSRNLQNLRCSTFFDTSFKIRIGFIKNNIPSSYVIDKLDLDTLLSFQKDDDYEVNFFSKDSIGDWSIDNSELFLKNTKITSGTSFNYNIPKIANNNVSRYYDGVNDFSSFEKEVVEKVKDNISFTIDFEITPDVIRNNTPVVYLGDSRQIVTYDYVTFTKDVEIRPDNYLVFYLSNSNGFPYIDIFENATKNIRLVANRKLSVNTETSVSITWQYTNNKATLSLYFDGSFVGSIVDQRTSTNVPLDITNINFNENFLGKSEFSSDPFYRGTIEKFRIWNTNLNIAQIQSRVGEKVSESDILYNNLLLNSNLDDSNNLHFDSVNINNPGLFNGGLPQQSLLNEISDSKQIQLSDDKLFLLCDLEFNNLYKTVETREKISNDTIKYNNFIYIFNDDNIEIFNTNSNIIVDDINIANSYSPLIFNDRLYLLANNRLYVIDLTNNNIVTNIQLGSDPRDLTITNNSVYISNFDSSNIYAVDITNFNIDIIFTPDFPSKLSFYENTLYCVHSPINTVSVIDTDINNGTYNTVIDTINVGNSPIDIENLSDKIHVICNVTNNNYIIDADINSGTYNTVIDILPLGTNPIKVQLIEQSLYIINNSSNDIDIIENGTSGLSSTQFINTDDNPKFITKTLGDIYVYSDGDNSPSIEIFDINNFSFKKKIQLSDNPLSSQSSDKYLYVFTETTLDIISLQDNNDIISIDLVTENIEQIYSTEKDIKSIYLENDELLFLEENTIYSYNTVSKNITVKHIDTDTVVDFTVIDNFIYLYKNNGIFTITNNLLFDASNLSQLNYLYSSYQSDIDANNVYWLDIDDNINVLSDNANTSGDLDLIALYSEDSIEDENSVYHAYVDNNKIYFRNKNDNDYTLINTGGLQWSLNLKMISDIKFRNSKLMVAVINNDNFVNIWEYDLINNSFVQFSKNKINLDRNLKPVFDEFNVLYSENRVRLDYIQNNDEYFTISVDNSLYFFKIEFNNKFNLKYLNHSLPIQTDNQVYDIDFQSSNSAVVKLRNNEQLYISNLTSSSNQYNLFKSDLVLNQTSEGFFVGENGLLFNDKVNSSTSWNDDVTINNLIYNNNFNDIEIIYNTNIDKEVISLKISDSIWIAANNGTFLKSENGGDDFKVIETGFRYDLLSLSFQDENIGLILTSDSRIYSTLSGGEDLELITLPDNLNSVRWSDVIIYEENKALIVGNNGFTIHMSFINDRWILNNFLNKVELLDLEIEIKNSDIDNNLLLRYRNKYEEDNYRQTINSIEYIGENKFILCGDKNLLVYLELSFENDKFIIPNLNFLDTQSNINYKSVITYKDINDNRNKAVLLSDFAVDVIEYDRWIQEDDSNIQLINEVNRLHNSDNIINDISIIEDYLVGIGNSAQLFRYDLFDNSVLSLDEIANSGTDGVVGNYNVDSFSILNELEDYNTREFFKSRMLFLDYYMGRKINIHLDDDTFITPSGSAPKNLPECFYFIEDEYFELTDYGRNLNDNNFLAYLDYFYINRRLLNGGLNKFGQLENWQKINKRITAKEKSYFDLHYIYEASNSDYEIFNDITTNTNFTTTQIFEKSDITKVSLNSSDFEADSNDVLDFSVLNQDKSLSVDNDITFYMRVKSPLFELYEISTVKDNSLIFENIRLEAIVDDQAKTITELEDEIEVFALEYINNLLKQRCKPTITSNDLTVDLNVVIFNQKTIVRELITNNNTLSIRELFSGDMIEELNGQELVIRNLNYFTGDYTHLEKIFNQHLLGDNYKLSVTNQEDIKVEGIVNDVNKYYNLESNIKLGIFDRVGPAQIIESIYPINYDIDTIYGPNYNIKNFLQDIDSNLFDDNYELPLPELNFTYNPVVRNSNGEFLEFSIASNKIFVGNDLEEVLQFKEGTFIDYIRGGDTVKKIYIKKIEIDAYERYPDKFRYILHTDIEIDLNTSSTASNVTLRGRNRLYEISSDLEYTDNIMIPLPNGNSTDVDLFYRTHFNQKRTSAAYAYYFLNDDNIRNNISSVLFLDEEEDWNINICNWQSDANLTYQPVDLHKLGIDKKITKAITIENTNFDLNDNKLALSNIDLDLYNYKLVNGLSLAKVEKDYNWLLNADIRNAVVAEEGGEIVWFEGDWLCGTWLGSKFYSGTIYDIEWIDGELYSYKSKNNSNIYEAVVDNSPSNTIWLNGSWSTGTWYNGTWTDGVWNGGNRVDGIWLNGSWMSGTWTGGNWLGGDWFNGTWLEGNFTEDNAKSTWYNGTWLGGDFESGVWKNGIFDQTDRIESRFGTKATLLNRAVWEYGLFKNGSFHSGLKTNEDGLAIASDTYSNSVWKNGVWESGDFYGGVFEHGIWNNGVWHYGFLQSKLEIDTISVLEFEKSRLILKFKNRHNFKESELIEELPYFVILGKPTYEQGLISEEVEYLGYNMSPVQHQIREIVDDYTLIVDSDIEFPLDASTSGSASSSGICSTSGCFDYTLDVEEDLQIEELTLSSLSYDGKPLVVTHWVSGSFLSGIWQNGYFANGDFEGGIFLDGVFDSGRFGT